MADPLQVSWTLASPFGIQLGTDPNHWNSGCVRDVLVLSADTVMVATDTGGVWVAREDGFGAPLADLDSPNLRCLSRHPAATPGLFRYLCGGDSLYESEDTSTIPKSFMPVLDAAGSRWQYGPIDRIVVDPDTNSILFASNQGIFWCPWNSSAGAPYALTSAVDEAGAPLNSSFYGLAATRKPPGLVRRFATCSATPSSTGQQQLLYGEWHNDATGRRALVFTKANVTQPPGSIIIGGNSTSLASTEGDPYWVYAARSDGQGYCSALYRSYNGGENWETILPKLVNPPADVPAGKSFRDTVGMQGLGSRANNCLAVSPTDSKIVVLGWQRGAVFVSVDRGESFTTRQEQAPFHPDLHALVFDPYDSRGKRLYIGSDGGVVRVDALGADLANANSLFNMRLATMQFRPSRYDIDGFGSLGGTVDAGFIGGGTQDTNVLYTSTVGPPQPWRPLADVLAVDDGHRFIGIDQRFAVYTYNVGAEPRLAGWNAGTQRFDWAERVIKVDNYAWTSEGRDPSKRLTDAQLVALRKPFVNPASAIPIVALACVEDFLFGLWFDSVIAPQGYWAYLGHAVSLDLGQPLSVPPTITAVHSIDGAPILVGYSGGAIANYSFARGPFDRVKYYAVPSALLSKAKPSNPNPVVCHVCVLNATTGFAVLRKSDNSHVLLRLQGDSTVTVLNTGRSDVVVSVVAGEDASGSYVFVCHDDAVLLSEDLGDHWRKVNSGLPRAPRGSCLFISRDESGVAVLYLATYGRSVWKTALTR